MSIEAGRLEDLTVDSEINVVITGGGARERALQWKLEQSERIGTVWMEADLDRAIDFALDPNNAIDMTIVSPDDHLAAGGVDRLFHAGMPAFGPTQEAAQIESSKAYGKRIMTQAGVRTAEFGVFDSPKDAHEYVDQSYRPLYVKASGLALGKGAIEALTAKEAHQAITDIMVDKKFKEAGDQVVIEDFLQGHELSLHAICDGLTYKMFPSSQDHKKALEGDKGLNTGGMGTLSPVPWFGEESVTESGLSIVKPVLQEMSNEGNPFTGLLYPGIIDDFIRRYVLEFNARFGDPETQVYMRRMKSDFLDLITHALAHRLDEFELEWSDDTAVCLVAASAGYPGSYAKGKLITGIEEAEEIDGVKIFLAGAQEEDGKLYTSGGRVLGVTAMGPDLATALDTGYAAMERIQFEGKTIRNDIGKKSLALASA
jgi:phosphoribosylamine--glycine ligase